MNLLPTGPWLPGGRESHGTTDLGIRLRDELYGQAGIEDARARLGALLPVLIKHEEFDAASRVCQAFLETWPVASLIEGARAAWIDEPGGEASAIIQRATEILSLARGWSILPSGLSLVPDKAWLASHLPPDARVQARGPEDGSEQIARCLGLIRLPAGRSPTTLRSPGTTWADTIRPAPAGTPGMILRAVCEAAILPSTPARLCHGQLTDTGWLLWASPYLPRAVHPSAVDVIHELESPTAASDLSTRLGMHMAQLGPVLTSLTEVGAITAVL